MECLTFLLEKLKICSAGNRHAAEGIALAAAPKNAARIARQLATADAEQVQVLDQHVVIFSRMRLMS